jgi:hypothetical protein
MLGEAISGEWIDGTWHYGNKGHMLMGFATQNDRVAILQPTLHPSKWSQRK